MSGLTPVVKKLFKANANRAIEGDLLAIGKAHRLYDPDLEWISESLEANVA